MPSPRRDRETRPEAVSWSVERRPRDAMPDFGDWGLPDWEPGHRQARTGQHLAPQVPRERRNGLPEPRPYRYRGIGIDTLTGHLSPWQLRHLDEIYEET
jgi:hypothetical protein